LLTGRRINRGHCSLQRQRRENPPPIGMGSSPSFLDALPDHRNGQNISRSIHKAQHAAGGAGVQRKRDPVPPKNVGRVTMADSRNFGGDLSNHRQNHRRPFGPSALPRRLSRGKTFPVCTIVGVVEFGMEGERGAEGVTPRPLSDIPSPAAGFRRRALFQEAASRQSRASLAPSATTCRSFRPFRAHRPVSYRCSHNLEAELRTRDRDDLAYGIS